MLKSCGRVRRGRDIVCPLVTQEMGARAKPAFAREGKMDARNAVLKRNPGFDGDRARMI